MHEHKLACYQSISLGGNGMETSKYMANAQLWLMMNNSNFNTLNWHFVSTTMEHLSTQYVTRVSLYFERKNVRLLF
mgnify:CR=1 FL=1